MFTMTSFRDALMRHMSAHDTTIAELAAGAGVSPDIIKKLRVRDQATTTAEVAMRIAAFYGKTLEQFIAGAEAGERRKLSSMLDLLSDDEVRVLASQIRGMLRDRE